MEELLSYTGAVLSPSYLAASEVEAADGTASY